MHVNCTRKWNGKGSRLTIGCLHLAQLLEQRRNPLMEGKVGSGDLSKCLRHIYDQHQKL